MGVLLIVDAHPLENDEERRKRRHGFVVIGGAIALAILLLHITTS